MTEHDALLRAIVENPDDDAARLVFADWLDENTDAFPTPAAVRLGAAFIRDDIAMSQRDEFDPLRLRWELVEKPRREAEEWVKETLPALPAGLQFDRKPLFRRGFPWAISDDTRAPSWGDEWNNPPADAFPLERITYSSFSELELEQLRTAAWRSRVRAIGFGGVAPAALRAARLHLLAELDRLNALAFRGRDSISAGEFSDLLTLPLFTRVELLAVEHARLWTDRNLELFAATGPGTLRELRLVNTGSSLGVAILNRPGASRLESLTIGGSRIFGSALWSDVSTTDYSGFIGGPPYGGGDLWAARWVHSCPSLHTLDISYATHGDTELQSLLASPLVSGLRRLSLARCSLNRERTMLLASGAFGNLRVLNLANNAVGNDGAVAIARSPHLAGLLVLNLSYAQVGDEGILAILESPLADGLVLLDLTGSPASEETKEVLRAKMGERVRL